MKLLLRNREFMSRALRQTLERIFLIVVGLILGSLLLGESGRALSPDDRDDSWIAGYRQGQVDYSRLLRKAEYRRAHRNEEILQAQPLAALPKETGG